MHEPSMQKPTPSASADAALLRPTPGHSPNLRKRLADFATLTESLDYAGGADTGFNFYSARGALEKVLLFRDLRDQAKSLP